MGLTALEWVGATPEGHNPPRLFSPQHPRAVGSLADAAVPWIEARVGRPLWWGQRLVLERALEVDSDGELCWRDVLFLAPRRAGKTVLLRELLLWRAAHSDLFGEPQTCLHLARDLKLARHTMAPLWARWVEDEGLVSRRTNGQESISWPDSSSWQITSHDGVVGWECSLAVVDEAWSFEPRKVEENLEPTQIGRRMPQTWFFSMPHSRSTSLVPQRVRSAADVVGDTMVALWGADPDADFNDFEVWRRAWPFVDAQRERDLARAFRLRPTGWEEQWLGVWRGLESGESEWPRGWGSCGAVEGDPPPGGVAVLESTFEKSSFGVAYAVVVDGVVRVWARVVESLSEAEAVVSGWGPRVLLVGLSLADWVTLPIEVRKVGSRELYGATGTLGDTVRRGRLVHEHSQELAKQVAVARTVTTDRGVLLSGKASRGGPVHALKAVAWAVDEALKPSQAPAPAIY